MSESKKEENILSSKKTRLRSSSSSHSKSKKGDSSKTSKRNSLPLSNLEGEQKEATNVGNSKSESLSHSNSSNMSLKNSNNNNNSSGSRGSLEKKDEQLDEQTSTSSTEKNKSKEDELRPPFSEDIYHKLPTLKVLHSGEATELGELSGPDEQESEVLFKEGTVLSGLVSSTYPFLPDHKSRQGDPICDVFSVKMYPNHVLIAVADGCNWGNRPKEAAKKACKAFMSYLEEHRAYIRDVQDAGHFLLRAFEKASREIIAGKDDIWEAGTTTLLGGIILELEHNKWCFLCVNVGDCKAFLWSHKTREVADVTVGNRRNLTNAKDPGGRLGPCMENGGPDLRNLKLYYVECLPGDLIFVVSDGVHDNCDPQHIGIPPADFGISSKNWEEAEKNFPQEAEAAKNGFRKKLLEDKINAITEEGKEVQPLYVTRSLIDYCRAVTKEGRIWMEQNPTKPLPDDYVLYPGKMDHVTCVSIKIGRVE